MMLSRTSVVMFLLGAVLLLSGCSDVNDSFLDPKGPIAAAQKSHLIKVTLLSMIAAGPVFILVPLMLWRYRYRNKNARYTPDWEFSTLLDSVMWGVPLAIIVVLSAQLWHNTKMLDPYRPIQSARPPLEVQVVGMDWKWLFIYPQYGVASVGEMAFPADRPVSMVLTSDTVMQSFLVSSVVGQIYVMPGMQTRLHIKADAPGVFEGENTQFNGIGFAEQKFNAVAMTDRDFDTWVNTLRTAGVSLSASVYRRLAGRSTPAQVRQTLGSQAMPERVTYFKDVPSDLFSSIIARYHTGLPIPLTEQPGGIMYIDNPTAARASTAVAPASHEGHSP
ncbi:MAG: cytochrome ubiquinol oxidase subunit II [Halioglobus sp.]|nr:cytochrome ubiquinol oxidase subunit II [Halioglobus sp.]